MKIMQDILNTAGLLAMIATIGLVIIQMVMRDGVRGLAEFNRALAAKKGVTWFLHKGCLLVWELNQVVTGFSFAALMFGLGGALKDADTVWVSLLPAVCLVLSLGLRWWLWPRLFWLEGGGDGHVG